MTILNQYNFIWDVEEWRIDITINYIKQYLNEGNSLPISQKYVCTDGFKLGSYLNTYRVQKRKNTLNSNAEKQLLKLGIKFPTHQENWGNNILLLSQFLKDKNVINSNTVYKGVKIGQWVSAKRHSYKNGTLSKIRYQQLLSLGIDLAKEGMTKPNNPIV